MTMTTFRLLLQLLLLVSGLTGNQALPTGSDGQREDVVTRCLMEVLSKALSKPDAELDEECKDILQAGVKYAPLDKKSIEATNEEEIKDHREEPEAKGIDTENIQALLKSVEPKRENLEDERSQESWSLEKRHQQDDGEHEEQRDKRSDWRPGRYHQKKPKRDEEAEEELEEDGQRSQESWDLMKRSSNDEEERYKRIWKPRHRYHHKIKFHKRGDEASAKDDYEERSQESWGLDDERDKRNWRPGRFHQRRHKRDEELSEETREDPNEERSQESWDVDTDRYKRDWRPGRYHQRRHKRDEEPDEERSQESWDFDKRDWRAGQYHQRRQKRDEELSEDAREDPDEERSQESWDFDTDRYKRVWRPGRFHQRRQKRDEELSEEAREEPDEERSQESWDFDTDRYKRDWRPGRFYQRQHKRDEELSEETREDPDEERSQESWDFNKRDWRPGRYHQKKHKRDEELSDEKREELNGERSQEYWSFDQRPGDNGQDIEKRIWKPRHRYHHKIKYHKRGGGASEEEALRSDSEDSDEDRSEVLSFLPDKRNPWISRGFYHPAWFKRDPEGHATSNKMDEVARLLSYKINQLTNQEGPKGIVQPRALTPHEEKALGNLAAMDAELKKIAAKLHDNSK
ncbi:secretogranin-1 [Entelurus aequoreus]|uniref:secretogranin-1 n=1 Tax=Entelurus aequoreus TaxID=161455 RepID=UPI002B1D727F|nr:secretogranin-1 [Entelurus aequoreus]